MPCSPEKKNAFLKGRQKRNFNKQHGAKFLPEHDPGDCVSLPAQKVEGKVVDKAGPLCSYMVQTPRPLLSRNRPHLNSLPELPKVENTSSTPLKSQGPTPEPVSTSTVES